MTKNTYIYILLHIYKKRHYFTTDSCVWQNFHLPPSSSLPAFFHQWPVFSLAPQRNRYSSNTLCNTINYLLVVKQTTRRLNPSKINGVLDGSCNFLLNWIRVSNFCHHTIQHCYRSTYSLYESFRRISYRLFVVFVLFEIYEGIGWNITGNVRHVLQ